MNIIDAIRARFPQGDTTSGPLAGSGGSEPRMTNDVMQAGGGRFPTMVHNYIRTNPYKPPVTPVPFPAVRLPFDMNVPPSINPQMIIRTGPLPHVTGRTVPPGAVGVGRKVIGGVAGTAKEEAR